MIVLSVIALSLLLFLLYWFVIRKKYTTNADAEKASAEKASAEKASAAEAARVKGIAEMEALQTRNAAKFFNDSEIDYVKLARIAAVKATDAVNAADSAAKEVKNMTTAVDKAIAENAKNPSDNRWKWRLEDLKSRLSDLQAYAATKASEADFALRGSREMAAKAEKMSMKT